MSIESVEKDFQKKVSEMVRLESEGIQRYRVFTPFRFDDGDHLVIVLKKEDSQWLLTDEAHTFMRLTYDVEAKDLHKGTRQKIISNALSEFHIETRSGELIQYIRDEEYGISLYSFVQAILKLSNVSFLSRERIRSTFKDDFRALLTEVVPKERLIFDWTESDYDPDGKYIIDCRINGSPKPLLIQALASDGATRDATITFLNFEKWDIRFRSLAIFEDQEIISRKVLSRFTDICDRQFSSLTANRNRIQLFLSENYL